MVELEPDGIGRFAEFGRQVAQVRGGGAVEEEFHQQLDTRFRGDQGFEHGRAFGVGGFAFGVWRFAFGVSLPTVYGLRSTVHVWRFGLSGFRNF